MKLNVPEMLKVLLVDDWEAVTKNNQVCGPDLTPLALVDRSRVQLVTLPRSPTVIELLDEFKEYILASPKPRCVDVPLLRTMSPLLTRVRLS